MIQWVLRILTAFGSHTKEERRIWRRLTQRKHDLKVLRANDNSWHFYRRWKSLLSWNAFFSDFTMSLLVFLFAFSLLLYSFQEDARLIATRKCKIPCNVSSAGINRDSCNEINVGTQHDIESPSNQLKITESECAWLRVISTANMRKDMQTSDAAPIYGLCIDKTNTRKSRSRKWKWSHDAIVKLPRIPRRRVENAAGSFL